VWLSAVPEIRNVLGNKFILYVDDSNFRHKSVNKLSTSCFSFSAVTTIIGKSINLNVIPVLVIKQWFTVPILCRSRKKSKIYSGRG
jgi:hypothetical protein